MIKKKQGYVKMKTLEFKNYFIRPLMSLGKRATIRKSDKGLKKDDIVECWFEGTTFSIFRIVESVEQVKFKDLDNTHAWFEGYKHVDLLKHELQCILIWGIILFCFVFYLKCQQGN